MAIGRGVHSARNTAVSEQARVGGWVGVGGHGVKVTKRSSSRVRNVPKDANPQALAARCGLFAKRGTTLVLKFGTLMRNETWPLRFWTI